MDVYLTIDRPQEGWDGHVGFVPSYVKELGLDPNMTAVLCGPPIMIKFTLQGLLELGFDKSRIFTTLDIRLYSWDRYKGYLLIWIGKKL